MSSIFDCREESQILAGMRNARQAIARGELIVIPTDTVYGVAADAFSPEAVQRLLNAKGRGRDQPPPVLVSGQGMMRALVEDVPEPVQKLVNTFWPGGLTVVLPAQASLTWDLGETLGTVAVRMPDCRVALELLEETGPLAVSSANLTGKSAAITAAGAHEMLGESVAVYLSDGMSETGVSSTIIDATSLVRAPEGEQGRVRILREGAISRGRIAEVIGDLLEPVIVDEPASSAPEPESGGSDVPARPGTETSSGDDDISPSGSAHT